MRAKLLIFSLIAAISFSAAAADAPSVMDKADELKIDPLMLVSLKECRNIMTQLGDEIFPGWNFHETPVLFYRPKVQDVLINFPRAPKGFFKYTGISPLGDEPIYLRNGSTLFAIDDQNTSKDFEGTTILVVADSFSQMKNQLLSILDRPGEFASEWLNSWNFIPSPHTTTKLIFHEAFHVYQDKMAPDKHADESDIARYPLLDPVNNALYVLEGNILRDALLLQNNQARLEKIKEFIAVRTSRQARLDKQLVSYENLVEYSEGLAKYVEYKYYKIGERVEPIAEMYYRAGFNGYKGVLEKKFKSSMERMVKIVSVSDDRFGNKFGTGPARYRLYDLGACQALLLDEISPGWKGKIFGNGVYLTDLLRQSLALPSGELRRYLEQAKTEYSYDKAYADKLEFKRLGEEEIKKKLADILRTDRTLITVSYKGLADKISIEHTAFGLTPIGGNSAIYELVPIKVYFNGSSDLKFKRAIPVIIDKEKKEITFAVSAPPSTFEAGLQNKLETDDFALLSAKMTVEREGKNISVHLNY